MRSYKTITGNEIRVSSNKRTRTYTIKKNGSTYRTYPMSKEEFNSCDWHTGNDWNDWLRNSGDYYSVN